MRWMQFHQRLLVVRFFQVVLVLRLVLCLVCLIKGTISSLITTQGTLSSWWTRIILSALLCFFIVIQSVDGFYEEESEISDCIMKQAGTWMGSWLVFVVTEGTRETASLCGFSSGG